MKNTYKIRIAIACCVALVFARVSNAVDEITFSDEEGRHHSIKEGDDVQITCNVSNRYPTVLFKDMPGNDDIEIVRNWSLLIDEKKYTYSFNSHSSFVTHSLLIKNVSQLDDGKYTCLQAQSEPSFVNSKTLSISVLHKSSQPECYDYDQNIYFVDEDVEFNLHCIVTDIGNPPVEALFSGLKNGTFQIATDNKITAHSKLMANLSFYPSISMNNTHISCTTSQEFQDTPEQHNQTCSFTPLLLLEGLETVIHPAEGILSIQEPSMITFVCSSNAGNVPEFQWNILSKIPDGVTYWNQRNHLLFSIEESIDDINATIEFECSAYLRNYSSIQVGSLIVNYTHSKVDFLDPVLLLCMILLPLLICCVLVGLFIYYLYDRIHTTETVTKGKSQRALPLIPSYDILELTDGKSKDQPQLLTCTSISFSDDSNANGHREEICDHQKTDSGVNKTGSKKRQRGSLPVPDELIQPVPTSGSNSDIRKPDNNCKEQDERYLKPDVDMEEMTSAEDPTEMKNESDQFRQSDLVMTDGESDVYHLVNDDNCPPNIEEGFYHCI